MFLSFNDDYFENVLPILTCFGTYVATLCLLRQMKIIVFSVLFTCGHHCVQ